MKKFREEAVKIYMALMFTFLPLYYSDNYYNILHDKRDIFTGLGAALTAVILLSLIIGFIWDICKKNRSAVKRNIKQELKSFCPMDAVMLAFAAVAVISTLCSEDREAAFTGSMAWDVGCGALVLGTVVYFILSRCYRGKNDIWAYFYIGALAVILIGVIDRLGYDFLVMHDEIPLQYEIFISTIGNVNFYAGFLSMVVPFFALAPLFMKSRINRILSYLLLLAAYLCMFITLANTTYIGVGIAMLFVVYFSLLDTKRLKNLAINAIVFMLSGMIADYLWKHPVTPRAIDTDTVSLLLLQYRLYYAVGFVGVFLLLFCLWSDGFREETKARVNQIIEKILSKVWLGFIVVFVVGVIAYVAADYSLELFNYRGSIWYFSWQGFLDGGIADKLIGVGPGLLDTVTRPEIENAPFYVVWDYYYNTAHNDVLEYLVTTGVLGAVLRLLTYILPFTMLKKGEQQTERAALLAALTGYIGQGLVTGPYVLTYAVYVVLLGAFVGYWRKSIRLKESN